MKALKATFEQPPRQRRTEMPLVLKLRVTTSCDILRNLGLFAKLNRGDV